MTKYTMDEWRNKGGGSSLFTFNVVSEALNKSFFEIQLHHHMYSKDGLPGMFHRSTRYLLLKYVYLLCVYAFIWSLLMWKGWWNRMHRMTVCGFSEMEGASPSLPGMDFQYVLRQCLRHININATVSIKACNTHKINKIQPFLKKQLYCDRLCSTGVVYRP